MIVLKGRVLDGNGGAPIEKGAVVLEDDRIRLVCRQSELPDDPTAEVYELEDGTIMPGLIDAHVHMGWGSATAVDWISMTPQLSMARALRDMAQLRQQGYTAFRDLGSDVLLMRPAVAEGLLDVPRIFGAGRIISQIGGHGDVYQKLSLEASQRAYSPAFIVNGVDEVRRACRINARNGADLIKIMTTGGVFSQGDKATPHSHFSQEEILALKEPQTRLIDLQGRLMLPGFADTHLHLLFYGTFRRRIDLVNTTTYEEVVRMCREGAEKVRGTNRWVIGCNFNQINWTDTNKIPDRNDLDAIASDVPIFLQRACGHIVCMNTMALQLAGLWDEREATTKQTMDFGPDGLPNGYVRENSAMCVQSCWERYTVEEIKDILESTCLEAASKGIVQVHTDDFNLIADDDFEDVLQAYRELNEEGRLPIRVNEQIRFRRTDQLQRFLDLGYRANDTMGHFKFGPVKFLCDGSLGSHSAAMRQPYHNDPDTKGLLLFTDEELYELAKLAYTNGYHLTAHCIGDAALEQMINTIQRVSTEFPHADRRNGIIHCQIMDEALQDRFRKLNLVAYVQPIFIKADSAVVDDCVGAELGRQSYNWRRYEDMGVHMCGGSDCPVEPFDVLPNIYCAVTRKGKPGMEAWYPENGVTLEEAVEMFTKEAAYASYDEAKYGTITVGKYADLVVLDRNIYDRPLEELCEAQVDLTMVEGEIVFQR